MEIFIREIYPVGHGGFALERVGNYSMVFDCGSKTNPTRVSQYINELKYKVDGKIDKLYISHFDKDHVNSIQELINEVGIKEAVIPYIPNDYTVVYNAMTGGAYSSMRRALSIRGIEVVELLEESVNQAIFDTTSRWEWIAKPMLSYSDWTILGNELAKQGLEKGLLQDPKYVNEKKKTINECFKIVFGAKGPNSKGLILLSQKIKGHELSNLAIMNNVIKNTKGTGALYTGDANLISSQYVTDAQMFLQRRFREKLFLVQIPHHGSRSNSGVNFDVQFLARYYFFHDTTSKRIEKNRLLYQSLTRTNSLLNVRDVDTDIICQRIVIC